MLNHNKQHGFTLIELMISLLIGLLLMLGLTTFLANGITSNNQILQAIQLNQEMRAIMTLISRDLRRAGYWANAATTGNPFQTITIQNSPNPCILFSYDRNDSGSLVAPNNVKYGYIWNSGAVWMRSNGAGDCSFNTTNWEALNDATVVTIGAPIITTSSANGTITIQFSGQLNHSANVKQTLTEVIQLENGPITFN